LAGERRRSDTGARNRVVWGGSIAAYREFASEALASGTGPMLDAGGGSAVFSAGVCRRASRPLVLIDRSVGMLASASGRLEGPPAALVHADLSDLPFAPGSVTTVDCFTMLNVLEDP
jgi:ubiquinone/menaquinone biosynthesis C-methylase UbiE